MLPPAHRLTRLAIVASITFALAACGGSSSDETSNADTTVSTEATTEAPTSTQATTTTVAPATTGVEIEGNPTFSRSGGPVVVTVKGTAFTDFALGNRPPLDGLPTGVYVVFGWFDEVWQPSAGVGTEARRIVFETQSWALPDESRSILDPDGTTPNVFTIDADGNFSVTIPVDCTLPGEGTMAIAVYPASGAIQADHEFLLPITCTD